MSNEDPIKSYLREVGALVPGSSTQRKRVLEEIETDLVEAVAAYKREGLGETAAAEQAVADFGSPKEVAAGFAEMSSPPRRLRGFRRWLPLSFPAIGFGTAVTVLILNAPGWLHDGQTRGERIVLHYFIWESLFCAVLTLAAFCAVRRADRDAAWRVAAWAPALLILLPLLTRVL